ncbi:MAG: hypothetical protein LE168_02870 [Endomicrobium sp.]|nr:hypothetical protein [Endomicrobium sp.]
MKGVMSTEISVFGNRDEHLKFKISHKGSRRVQCVFWNKAKVAKILQSESALDIAFQIDIIGESIRKIAQLQIIDIEPVLAVK